MSIFDETKHPRATTGTFTDKEQTGPEVWLSAKRPSGKVLSRIDFAEGIRSPDPRIVRAATAGLFAEAREIVRYNGAFRGLDANDVEDATSDVMLSLLKSLQKGSSVHRGLIQVNAMTKVSQFVNGPVKAATARGLKVLVARTEEQETYLGRPLSDRERDELAFDIRDDWDDHRNRPVIGFQDEARTNRVVFVDPADLTDLDDGRADTHEPTDVHRWDETFAALESKELRASDNPKGDAEAPPYAIYASSIGLPTPAADWIDSQTAERMIEELAPDIATIAAQYLDGTVDDRSAAGLFAPFDSLPTTDRRELAEQFASHRDFAGALWTSAVRMATISPATKRRKARLAAAALRSPRRRAA